MTLDQLFGRMCESAIFTRGKSNEKSRKVSSLVAVQTAKRTEDGKIIARSSSGALITGRVVGTSKAQQAIQKQRQMAKLRKAEGLSKATKKQSRG